PGAYTATWTTNTAVNWQNVLIGITSANAAQSSNRITIAWSPSVSLNFPLSGYFVERCAGAGCTNFVSQISAPPTLTIVTDSFNLAPGATYSYRVRATDTQS